MLKLEPEIANEGELPLVRRHGVKERADQFCLEQLLEHGLILA
jgi:hypothetical protein